MHAVNQAIASGYTVKVGNVVVDGATIKNDVLMYFRQHSFNPLDGFSLVKFASPHRIVAVMPQEHEVDVIYEPPPKMPPEEDRLGDMYSRASQKVNEQFATSDQPAR
jgi:hypothetical protein